MVTSLGTGEKRLKESPMAATKASLGKLGLSGGCESAQTILRTPAFADYR